MRSGRDVQRSPGFERRLRPDRLNQQPAGPTHLCPATDGETPNLVCGVAGPTEDVMAINPSAVRMQRSAHHSSIDATRLGPVSLAATGPSAIARVPGLRGLTDRCGVPAAPTTWWVAAIQVTA